MTHARVERLHRPCDSPGFGGGGKDFAQRPQSLGAQPIGKPPPFLAGRIGQTHAQRSGVCVGGDSAARDADSAATAGDGSGSVIEMHSRAHRDDTGDNTDRASDHGQPHWSQKILGRWAARALAIGALIWIVFLLARCGATGKSVGMGIGQCVSSSVSSCSIPTDLANSAQWVNYGLCLAKTSAPCVATVTIQAVGAGQTAPCNVEMWQPDVDECVAVSGCVGAAECESAVAQCWHDSCSVGAQ